MKLATYNDGSRDGQLVVVSRDLSLAHFATGIASRMQQLLDDWNFLSPQLEDLYATLNNGKARHAFAHDARLCMAPLPRAFHWALCGPLASDNALAGLVVHTGAGDVFAGACDPALFVDLADGPDCRPGLAAIAADVPAGSAPAQALEAVRLLLLAGDWTLRGRGADAPHAGQPAAPGRTGSVFGPVAVTPDELGPAWQGGRVRLPLQWRRGARAAETLDTGSAMPWHFGELLAALAATRPLFAGCVVGCLFGVAATDLPPLEAGDGIRIDLRDGQGHSVFGAIEQTVRRRGDLPA